MYPDRRLPLDFNFMLCPTGCSQNAPVNISTINIQEHPWHLHRDLEIIYVLEGRLNAQISLYDYEIRTGGIAFINCEVPHIFTADYDNKSICFHFNLDFFSDYIPGLKEYIFVTPREGMKTSGSYINAARTLLNQIFLLYFSDEEKSSEQIVEKAVSLFSLLTTHFSQWQQKGHKIMQNTPYKNKPIQFERLNRILNYIYDHYSEKITLETIASEEYLSKYYISHLFSEGLGMSFKSYLTLARVEIAHYLLLGTDYSLEKISVQCGFSNPRNFRQAYIKYVQMTPQETRVKNTGHTIDDIPLLETNLLDTLSAQDLIKLVTPHNYTDTPVFSNISKPEIWNVDLDLHRLKAKGEFQHNKTVLINHIPDLFSHDFENAATLLEKFSFESVTVFADTLNKFKHDFGGLNCLLPILKSLKEYDLAFNVADADPVFKNELEKLTSSYSKYAPLTFQQIPGTAEISPVLMPDECHPEKIISKAFRMGVTPPSLYPYRKSIFLIQKNNLKSRYFYTFYALNRMKQNLAAQEAGYFITFYKKDVSILIINGSATSQRYLFRIQSVTEDYICHTTHLKASNSNEAEFLPANVKNIPEMTQHFLEVKCSPPCEISFIPQTPEHHLYVTADPKSAMLVELMKAQ